METDAQAEQSKQRCESRRKKTDEIWTVIFLNLLFYWLNSHHVTSNCHHYLLKMHFCMLTMGEYSASEVTDNFSGEGCHGVLFPA